MTAGPITDGGSGRSILDILAWAARLTEPRLRETVDRLPEPVRTVAGYQFGWWEPDGSTTSEGNKGKGVRPALGILGARAAGVELSHGITGAVAVEMIHNFSLLHDDIMDNDEVRRHRPTAWVVFGKRLALLTGDALHALAIGVLSGARDADSSAAVSCLNSMTVELVRGQSADLAFEERTGIGLSECLAMAHEKTASLISCACVLGPILAGCDSRQIEPLAGFGRHLGLSYQLRDDLIGIWGDASTAGKSVDSDLRMRKKSLPVVAALSTAGPAGAHLAELLSGQGPLAPADVSTVRKLVEDLGGRAWAEAEMRSQLDRARACLDDSGLEPAWTTALMKVAEMVADRER